MYVDEGVVVSLEYYVFNDEQDHIHLTDINEAGITEESILRLNTDKYQSTGAHPMSIFRDPPKNYVDCNKDYLQNPKLGKFMTAEEPELKKSFKISGVLSFWKAEIYGTLEKMCEKSFTHECEFAYTTQGNMALQITNDRKLLTLTYISKYGDKNKDGNGIVSPNSQVKIMAWAVDTKKYKFTQTLDKKFLNMNDSLSCYLQQNAQEIRLIRSIKVTASFKYVILTYNQQKLIPKNQEQSYVGAESTKKGQKLQIAIKYAIFEVKSGKLVFEYGGFSSQLKTHDKEKLIYSLGIAVQDVSMTRGYDDANQKFYQPISKDENINFFLVGEFLDWTDIIKQDKKKQERQQRELSFTELEEITEIEFTEFDWTLTVKHITLAEIIQSGDTPEQRLQWVNSELINYCQQLAVGRVGPDKHECFQFKSGCILLQQNWQASIIVTVNSHFDQIGILNLPTSSNLQNRRLYFLYKIDKKKSKFHDETPMHTISKNARYSMPVVIKQLPKEGLIQHGRNSQLKRDMYYTVQQRLQRTYAVCLRFQKYEQEELGNLQIQIHEEHQAYNQIDVWCFKEPYMKGPPAINGHIDEEEDIPLIEHDGRPVMQLCSIDSQNLQIELMTKIPRKSHLSRYDFFIKSSDSLYQQQGQWPFFAYCLGIEKICLLHLQRDKRSRQYYYKCQFGHKFLCFCEFNNYSDAGFFAENLLIEGCVKFAFLTEFKNFVYLNILLIDPYHPKIQFSVFTSTFFIAKDDFKAKDSIEAAFIIPTKSSSEISGKDKDFQIYLIVQYNSILRRCKFKKTAEEIDDDSDFGIDQTDLFDGEEITKVDDIKQTYLEHIFMQMDEKNFLYYVAKQGTQFKIMEINPKRNNFKHHLCIYEWRANKCSALSVEFNGKEFSFIDDTKTTYTLDRQVNSRQLQLISESNFNEMYQQDFKHEEYDPVIMCRQYIIQGNKLFYLESDEPFPNGYLAMETITENFKSELPPEFNDEIKWFQGPVIFNGSNQFGAMDRVRKFYAYLNVMALPDSTTKTLMIDNNSQINMSTFLSNGEILLRCAHRYLVFDKEGYFKAQVYFDDQEVRAGEVAISKNQNKGGKTLKKVIKKVIKKQKKDFIKQKSYDLGLQEDSETSDEFEFNENVDQHNKMKLIQFSSDNKKFLFLNELSRQLKVYKFVSRIVKEGKQSHEEYFFKKMYDLEYKYCEILKDSREFMYNEQKYEFKEYLEKFVNINVEIDGGITLVLISQPDRLVYTGGNFSQFELIVSFYKVESRNGVFKCQIFNIKKQLPMPPIEEIKECHSFESESIEDRINEIKLVQKRLLPELKDKTDLQIMEDDQEYVETRIRRKINSFFSHDILVIWQGSWLRWTRIKEGVNDDQEKCYRIGELQKLDITFEKYSEIIRVSVIKLDQKVDSGFKPDKIFGENELIQILLKVHSSDQSDNKYIILTWNLTYNYQIQIMEVSDLNNERLEFNLVKGLNQKLNYFFDSNQITDLEICIPNQINRNQQEQLRHRSYHQILTTLLRFHNQRKIFFDGSRYLQTKVPQALVFSYSYIQLRQWRDIFFQKNKIQMFQEVVKLEDFLINFDGQTLFHIYILNNDVLQYIHDEYMNKKAAGNLTELEEIVPLMIVMSDSQNYTPLFRAIQKQNQKGFELMIEMIKDISNRFISKLIIRSLPKMLRIDSSAVLQFFENAVYKPLAYQEPIIMPWPDIFGDEPQFFTSKTTLLTQEIILQKFFAKKTEQKEEKKQEVVEEEQKGFETKENKLFNKLKKLKEARDFEFALERGNLDLKAKLREYILREDLTDESLSSRMQGKELDLESQSMGTNRRVQVQVLDFDFLFQNLNSEVLIQILSQLESNKILTRQSIKCFVELMWSQYQPVIFYKIYVYYLTYLFLSVYLCSQQLPYFWEEQKLREAAIAEGRVHQTSILSYILVSINLFISLRILAFFASFELIQLMDTSLYDYFTSTWNVVDVVQMLINSLLILYTTFFLLKGEHLIPQKSLVRYAAYGNFLMWFKMFYWMRLFKATAKYVTLIVETLTDLTFFMIMVGIIIQAFATFFYIINLNAMEEGLSYLGDYGMPQYLTSVVQVYFYSIGEFSYDSFSTGANVKSTWIMFLLATFVNSILFMNMVIAIMGQTFGQVTENEEANGLQQQVALIADYVSLVDANEVWGNTPYIILVQAVEQTEESEVEARESLQTMQELVEKKIEKLAQTAIKKLASIEEKLDQ